MLTWTFLMAITDFAIMLLLFSLLDDVRKLRNQNDVLTKTRDRVFVLILLGVWLGTIFLSAFLT